MYKYETHLHTAPVSKCGKASVAESLTFYKKMGYDGVFITNHFVGGNISMDKSHPYEERVEFYFSDYEKALPIGEKLGLKVFCGVEMNCGGPDILVYGLDKQWYLEHPEVVEIKKSEALTLMRAAGALLIHAHPFREATYIDHIHLYPRHVHGVEIINSSRPEAENAIAKLYAAHYGLLTVAGSDNHVADRHKVLAGLQCEEPICDVADFIEKVKTQKTEIFTFPNPLLQEA